MLLRFYPLSLNNERFQMADNGFFSFKYPLNACYFCQTGSVASNKYLDYLLLAWHRALQWTTCTDDHAYTTGICVLRHILEAENYSSNTRTIPSIQSQLIGCLSGGSFCLSGGAFVCLAGLVSVWRGFCLLWKEILGILVRRKRSSSGFLMCLDEGEVAEKFRCLHPVSQLVS